MKADVYVNEWQPIVTAPRDGTRILVFVPTAPKPHQMVGSFAPSGHFLSWPGRWQYEPTHWAPLLPDPPKEQQ